MSSPLGGECVPAIIQAILHAVASGPLVEAALAERVSLSGPCRVLAVGKASVPMAKAAARLLGGQIRAMLVVEPEGSPSASVAGMVQDGTSSERWVADHPIPTARNIAAAERVREFVAGVPAEETLLVLLSGGASAMLCLPREPLGLDDIAEVTDAMLRAGAPIESLNAVRKHCEVLKGGGLTAASGAGRLVSLVLSDVLGDRLDVIGSGPTAPDPTNFTDALHELDRWGVSDASPAVAALLAKGAVGEVPETVKPDDPLWSRVENHIIGSNLLAIDAAVEAVSAAGYAIVSRREMVQGEAAEIGRALVRSARELQDSGRTPAAIVWGGETTVTVGDASGIGGRNQELALAASIELDAVDGLTVLSLATDGRDGPTDAAGGVADGTTCARVREAGIDPALALNTHDSHAALDAAGALVRTGPSGTNVNDVMLALID